MPEDMSDRVPEDLPDRMPEDMPDHMPEDMPDRMPNRMSEDMSDRMPEDSPVRKCINVMVGITRSKVIYVIVGNRPRSPKPALRSVSLLAQKSCVSGYTLNLIERRDLYMMEFSISIHFLEGNPLTTEMWVTPRIVINLNTPRIW